MSLEHAFVPNGSCQTPSQRLLSALERCWVGENKEENTERILQELAKHLLSESYRDACSPTVVVPAILELGEIVGKSKTLPEFRERCRDTWRWKDLLP